MIKAEVIFDESEIQINGFTICEHVGGLYWFILDQNGVEIDGLEFENLEQAIKYCLEQSK